MHICRNAIARDRLKSRETYRADSLFAAFAEYADGLCVRIDVSHVERSHFAQSQATAVEQFHDGDVAQRHPDRRRLGFPLARWSGKKLFDLLTREDQGQFLFDFW